MKKEYKVRYDDFDSLIGLCWEVFKHSTCI